MKVISAATILSAIVAVGALATPGVSSDSVAPVTDKEKAAPAPFATLIDAPTGLTRANANATSTVSSKDHTGHDDWCETDESGTCAMYTCSQPLFSGFCQWLTFDAPYTCKNVPPWYANTISSMDIFDEEVKCFVYTGDSCSDDLMRLDYYNTPMSHLDARFDNRIRSFFCFNTLNPGS